MSAIAPIPSTGPSSDERTLATLAHVLQLVGWWIAPLIIFLIKRDSRFVSFHALQALLLQGVYMAFWGLFMIGWMAVIMFNVFQQSVSPHAPPPMIFLVMPLFWLTGMGIWTLILVAAIVYGIKAGRGEWAEYPVIGPIARRLLKLGPGGVPV